VRFREAYQNSEHYVALGIKDVWLDECVMDETMDDYPWSDVDRVEIVYLDDAAWAPYIWFRATVCESLKFHWHVHLSIDGKRIDSSLYCESIVAVLSRLSGRVKKQFVSELSIIVSAFQDKTEKLHDELNARYEFTTFLRRVLPNVSDDSQAD
jgi:hypothetical protein